MEGAAARAGTDAVMGASGVVADTAGTLAGALATGGCDVADSAGTIDAAGALASAGAGPADPGAAEEVVEPGTPPVTLIESPLTSSPGAGCATGADESSARSGRIELPTVPSPIAGTEAADDIGVLTPS